MQKLNLPQADLKITTENGKTKIFDIIRKKYVVLTPEEQVRQEFIHYLINKKNYPKGLLAVEKKLKIYNLEKRTDIVLYNTSGNPAVIIECKAPSVNISQKTFDQIARYNMNFKAEYLIVTNGIKHYCCKPDYKNKTYGFLKEIPDFEQITNNKT
ncbi:MAG: type I restriction enzyme HsdR N-terminal domain-containing protein [Chlorobi bacterium]|nr:type I restriction enzyme HsdR N-terminal domain-containing protein [Chlorobiota bacterium]